MRNDDKTKESTAVKVEASQCGELAEALTTGDGPLVAGMHAAVRTVNAEGDKALIEAMTAEKAVENKGKGKKDKANKGADKLEPKTWEESMSQYGFVEHGMATIFADRPFHHIFLKKMLNNNLHKTVPAFQSHCSTFYLGYWLPRLRMR